MSARSTEYPNTPRIQALPIHPTRGSSIMLRTLGPFDPSVITLRATTNSESVDFALT
jgi:hypothetical protein